MKGNIPSKKKIAFPVNKQLNQYLSKYQRITAKSILYEDLIRFSASVPLLDLEGNDTLWETVFYDESEREDLYKALTFTYALLKTDGDKSVLDHLTVARIDFCTFGNTKPFRIRIINRLNDNYDHYYVKKVDSSRIYGLELEDLVSPNQVNYLVNQSTLIEEHIIGIPGDEFMKKNLEDTVFNQIRMAKEFVKFNERCFVRLLGDMRSYNYVFAVTPDIEGNQYRMRAIDFDQQSYEGRKNFYLPQYFKENNPVIFLGIEHMSFETVRQYQLEERSLIAHRVNASYHRIKELFDVMTKDHISSEEKVKRLGKELSRHHNNDIFLKCRNMGELVMANIELLLQKDFKQSLMFQS